MQRVCVYCGSATGARPERYREAAAAMGNAIARAGLGLVYGGGRIGLMGIVADAALAAGGEVIGVIPEKLNTREVGHQGLTELLVVEGMHARKSLMLHLSSAFVALPGGWGTLEELFEAAAWRQLQLHAKPIGLLNVQGYFDGLLAFLDHAAREGFARPPHAVMLHTSSDPAGLLSELQEAAPA